MCYYGLEGSTEKMAMIENAKPQSTPDRESLLAAFEGVREAILACDTEGLRNLYSEDFRSHTVRGDVEGLAAVLDAYRPGGVRLEIFEVEDLIVEVIGDVGILTGLGQVSGSFENTAFRHRVRFVDIYVWRDGRWCYHFSQSTEIVPELPSPGGE
jgi:ketosteroid isomerase-like protein